MAAAVMALAIFSPGRGTDVTEAQGPNNVTVLFELANGGVIPGVGGAVETQVQLGIAHNGAAATDIAPSDQAFFDTTVTRSNGTVTTRGPGHPGGGGMAATAIATRAGIIGFTIQTNQVVGCGPSGVCIEGSGGQPAFSHLVTQCGDNYGLVTTRDYSTAGDSQVTVNSIPTPFGVFVGNMAGKDTLLSSSTGFLGWDATPDELLYFHSGGALIQTYDDDNNNGVPDSQEGSPANEDTAALGPADPYALQSVGTVYTPGTPETQHDRDDDGLPEGHEAMPDFLPLLAEALGLRTFWEGRTYGIADVSVALHELHGRVAKLRPAHLDAEQVASLRTLHPGAVLSEATETLLLPVPEDPDVSGDIVHLLREALRVLMGDMVPASP